MTAQTTQVETPITESNARQMLLIEMQSLINFDRRPFWSEKLTPLCVTMLDSDKFIRGETLVDLAKATRRYTNQVIKNSKPESVFTKIFGSTQDLVTLSKTGKLNEILSGYIGGDISIKVREDKNGVFVVMTLDNKQERYVNRYLIDNIEGLANFVNAVAEFEVAH